MSIQIHTMHIYTSDRWTRWANRKTSNRLEKNIYIYRDCWKQTNEAPTGWKTNGKKPTTATTNQSFKTYWTHDNSPLHSTQRAHVHRTVQLWSSRVQTMYARAFIYFFHFYFYFPFAPVDGTKTSVWSELMDEQTYNRNHCYTPKTCYLIMMWFCCRCVWMCVAFHSTIFYTTRHSPFHWMVCSAMSGHTKPYRWWFRHRIHNRYKWSASFSIPFHAMPCTIRNPIRFVLLLL